MVVISKTIIREFGLKHADANDAISLILSEPLIGRILVT